MLRKLLQKNINVWQLIGYSVATLVGLLIVMVAVQFYGDAAQAMGTDSGEGGIGLLSSRNIVISKPVSLASTLTGEAPGFSQDDIAEIMDQPWVGDVQPFRAADFSVQTGVELDGRAMHTALFLESVPDSLLDIDARQWQFDPANPSIPIIISKDYLTLYNFGFAATGRMPMISEAMLSSVPLQITLSGNGRAATLPARIVGYSNWLNTVAVPQDFMEWAHKLFGRQELSDPSRVVIRVSDPSSPAIDKFLSEHDYERAGSDDGSVGRATYFLKILTSVVVAVGVVITILAIGILILSIFLLIQKNRATIAGLLLIGFSPGEIGNFYCRLVLAINSAVFLLGAIGLCIIAPLWQHALASIDVHKGSVWLALCVGFIIMLMITLLNIYIVRRLTRKIFLLN